MSQVNFHSANGLCSGTATLHEDGWTVTVRGVTKVNDTEVKYMAAASPDLRLAYSGSGLPWGSADIAYDHTNNKGSAPITNGQFAFTITRPNCYYIENGSKLVAPHVHMTIGNQHFDVELGVPCVPNRSLKNLEGRPCRTTHR